MMEKTFLMVKPDGVQRGLIGDIVSRFEKKGLQLVGSKLMSISDELAKSIMVSTRKDLSLVNLLTLLLLGQYLQWFGKVKM